MRAGCPRRLCRSSEAEESYGSVDIVLVPSQWQEPFGRVAAEARVAGQAVVTSRLGGIPEATCGYPLHLSVDRAADPAAWREAMLQMRVDVHGATGRLRPAEASAPRQAVARSYIEVYEGVVADHRGSMSVDV